MSIGPRNEMREPVTPTLKEQWAEVLVFLFLIVPSMVLSFWVVRQGNTSFGVTASATIFRDLALVSLIAFFLWRNDEHVDRLGWTSAHKGLGAALFVPFFLGTTALDQLLRDVGFSVPATPLPRSLTASDRADFLLACVLVAVVAAAEETIFRGYLILRLRAVTRSATVAVLLSSVTFSLGHGYEGSAGVVTVGVIGAVLALIYLWRRSLTAPIVMHFLQDFIGIVLAPLVGTVPS